MLYAGLKLDVAIPADVLTYRAAVRTASNSMEAQINAVTTHAAFVTVDSWHTR
jgi:hypothetical protein